MTMTRYRKSHFIPDQDPCLRVNSSCPALQDIPCCQNPAHTKPGRTTPLPRLVDGLGSEVPA